MWQFEPINIVKQFMESIEESKYDQFGYWSRIKSPWVEKQDLYWFFGAINEESLLLLYNIINGQLDPKAFPIWDKLYARAEISEDSKDLRQLRKIIVLQNFLELEIKQRRKENSAMVSQIK